MSVTIYENDTITITDKSNITIDKITIEGTINAGNGSITKNNNNYFAGASLSRSREKGGELWQYWHAFYCNDRCY